MLGRWALSRPRHNLLGLRNRKVHASLHCRTITRVSIHQQKHHVIHPSVPRQRRAFFTDAIPTVLIPPTIFTTLLLGLWTWKCFWIVVMQDKLLYIAWLPPFARSEKITDYESQCSPVQWDEKQIRSLDGTKLAVCEGRMKSPPLPHGAATTTIDMTNSRHGNPEMVAKRKKRVVICYFQGNGGSTPLRLPLLSDTLRTVTSASQDDNVEYIVVALSYRGYWTSSGRATQSGIELDAQAFLAWVSKTYAEPDTDLRMILWGHSLGSAVASTALATYLARQGDGRGSSEPMSKGDGDEAGVVPITGLVMEAPTSSTKDMLINLYPQKWLPYRYLWPFLWNNWDSSVALERMAEWRDQCRWGEGGSGEQMVVVVPRSGIAKPRRMTFSPPPILMLSAEKDEVIPPHAADQLEADARRLKLVLQRKDVTGAMHTEALVKVEGKRAMMEFLLTST